MIPKELFQATTNGLASELEEAAEDRRQERADHCGSYVSYFAPGRGKISRRIFYCDLWRRCEACLARRVVKFRDRVGRAVSETSKRIYVLTADDDDVESIMNKIRYRKIQYLRLPVGGVTTIFFECNCEQLSAFLDWEPTRVTDSNALTSEGWDHVCNTPAGLRTSGNLGKVDCKDGGDEFTISVEVDLVATTANILEQNEAAKEAFEAVPVELLPSNAEITDEVVDLLEARMRNRTARFIEALQAKNKSCYVLTSQHVKVQIGRIKSKAYNDVSAESDRLQQEQEESYQIAASFWDQV